MIKNPELLEEFENNFMRQEKPDFFHNLRLYEAMYRHACALKVLPSKDLLEGLETKIRLARVVNVSKTD